MSTTPTFLYKIVLPPLEKPSDGSSNVLKSSLDESSGFIHLSTAEQIPGTADRFFSDVPRLVILKVHSKPIEPLLKWEAPPDSDPAAGSDLLFPHVYGEIGWTSVDSVHNLTKEDRTWSQILQDEHWLV